MVFTQAMRDKALAVRRSRKLERMTARAPKAPKELKPKTNGEVPPGHVTVTASTAVTLEPFDWLNAPLPQATERLNNLKREYDRAAQIILSRTSRLPHSWVCWSQLNKSLVPKSVLAQCRNHVPDGKWSFKDDGHKNERGELDPIVTCSMLCHEVYLKNKPIGGLGRR